MLKEAIQYVFGLGESKQRATVISQLSTARDVLLDNCGALVDRKAPLPIRAHQVDSVGDLCAAAERWNTNPVVWISGDAVVLCANDEDRHDRVTLPLRKSHSFKTIEKLVDSPRLDQVQIVRLLSIDLRDRVNVAPVLQAIRKIKFRQHVQGHADVQHGNESMGRQVESEVIGIDGTIPDEIKFSGNIYANPGESEFSFGVTLSLEIDVANQKFILRPVPDDIEAAVDAALFGIRSRIEENLESVPVFFGRP